MANLLRGGNKGVRTLIFVVLGLAVLAALWWVISYYWTDYLWYQEMGQTDVFWTPFVGRLLVGLFFALIFFGLFYTSVWVAHRAAPKYKAVDENPAGNVLELIARRGWSGKVILAASLLITLVVGISYGGRWERVLLFLNQSEFGYADPLFGKDASFFVYTLPLLTMLVDFVITASVLAIIFTLLVYLSDRAFTLNVKKRIVLAPRAYAHLSVLVAVLLLAKAADFALGRWALVHSTTGTTFGANYTDVHVVLPMLSVLAIVTLVAAVLCFVNLFRRGWKVPLAAILLVFAVWVVGGKIVPAAVQSLQVKPNEIAKDSEYIQKNLDATRWAFDIDDVASIQLAADLSLTASEVAQNAATTENVRIWEPRPAKDAYAQLQALKPYYTFKDVDVDRYVLDGELRQVLISAREMNQAGLNTKSWVTEHLKYTHGYGFAMSPVNEAETAGSPVFLISEIPLRNKTDLRIEQPQIYYGEMGNSFVIVNSDTLEFDYPEGATDRENTYEGDGGISIGSFFRQAAFTFRMSSLSILTTSSITQDSRIMIRRTLQERVQALAPFLTYDYDPYLVLRDDGSLVWMWDAYATTSLFPYSQPWVDSGTGATNYIPAGTNYVRNSVKVVIDAYTGQTTFYQLDADDAIVNSWAEIYQDLFTPADQMPADIRAHMRYPENLYSVQADTLTTYHVTDPATFYNFQDVWEVPTEIYDESESPTQPYYQVLALPGETKPESALLLPFAPKGKANMVALLAARQDGDNYGELLLVDFPKGTPPDGPALIEAKISNDPTISQRITLWDQAGSNVIRGNLLVIPIGQSVVYFEPLYLQANSQNTVPELRQVIVAYGSRIVMEATVTQALVAIFGEDAAPGTETPGGATTTTTVPSGPTTPSDVAALAERANQLYLNAIQAQRAGDWAEYGRLLEELGSVLEQLTTAQ